MPQTAAARRAEMLATVRASQGAVILTMVIFGFNNIFVKKIGFEGLVLSGYRLFAGALLMSAVLWIAQRRVVDWPMLRAGLFGASMYGLSILGFFSALKMTSAANVAIIATLQAAVVLIFVNRLFGEPVSVVDLVLTGVALFGTALVVLAGADNGTSTIKGDLVALAAMLAGTGYFAGSKRARLTLGAIEYQTVAMVVAAAIAMPVALASGQGLTGTGGDWALFAYLVVGGTAAHFSLNWAHAKVDLKFSSLMTLAVPIVTAAAAWVLLDEALVLLQGAGMLLVIGSLGVAVARQ